MHVCTLPCICVIWTTEFQVGSIQSWGDDGGPTAMIQAIRCDLLPLNYRDAENGVIWKLSLSDQKMNSSNNMQQCMLLYHSMHRPGVYKSHNFWCLSSLEVVDYIQLVGTYMLDLIIRSQTDWIRLQIQSTRFWSTSINMYECMHACMYIC